MRITSPLFDAFLKCATKCHLRSLGESGSGNEYAEWVRDRDESYQRDAARALQGAVPETERVVPPPATESLKAAKWRLAVDLVAQTPDESAASPVRESRPNEETRGLGGLCSEQLLESRLHAVERVRKDPDSLRLMEIIRLLDDGSVAVENSGGGRLRRFAFDMNRAVSFDKPLGRCA